MTKPLAKNPNIAKHSANVRARDIACANRCVPATVIFADHEDHVTDLRRRAANEIAMYRLAMAKRATADTAALREQLHQAIEFYSERKTYRGSTIYSSPIERDNFGDRARRVLRKIGAASRGAR